MGLLSEAKITDIHPHSGALSTEHHTEQSVHNMKAEQLAESSLSSFDWKNSAKCRKI